MSKENFQNRRVAAVKVADYFFEEFMRLLRILQPLCSVLSVSHNPSSLTSTVILECEQFERLRDSSKIKLIVPTIRMKELRFGGHTLTWNWNND
jgi:hypothetical protein